MRRAAAAAEATLSALAPVLVLADYEGLSGPFAAYWSELRRAAAERIPGAEFVALRARVEAPAVGVQRPMTRHLLQIALASDHVPEQLVSFAARRVDEPRDVVWFAGELGRRLNEHGSVDLGALDESEMVSSLAASKANSSQLVAPSVAPDVPRGRSALTVLLGRGEEAAVLGQVHLVLRMCVRTTTIALEQRDLSAEDVCRLSDLWMECGRWDAAEDVLREFGNTELPAHIGRLGRAWVGSEQYDGLDELSKRLRAASRAPDDVAEADRFDAVQWMRSGRHNLAYRSMRDVLSKRGDLAPSVSLRAAITLSNALRRQRRYASAGRVLRWVLSASEKHGAVRTSVAASMNMLLVRGIAMSPEESARAWDRLTQSCLSWGLAGEAAASAVRCARAWMLAGNPSAAKSSLERFYEGPDRMLGASSAARRSAQEVWQAALDRCETLSTLGVELRSPGICEVGDASGLHRLLLHHEVNALPLGVSLLSCTARFVDLRAMRTVLRALTGDKFDGRRGDRIDRVLSAHIDTGSPVLGHFIRALVREAQDGALTAWVRDRLRRESLERPASEVTTALVVLCLAWGRATERETCAWLLRTASPEERARPPGVRVWEWRLGLATAELGSLSRDPSDAAADEVIQAMESLARGLPAEVRTRYMRSLPLKRVADVCGLSFPAELDEQGVLADAWRLTALRAHLHRASVSHRAARGRAAGLERVLATALRLRSTGTIDELLREIASGVLAVCRAERAVVLYEGTEGGARAKVATLSELADISPVGAEISRTALERVRGQGRACLIDDAVGDDELGERPSVRLYRPRSLIVAPLRSRGRDVGYLYVENRTAPKSFSESDLELVEGFASQAALALENAQLVEELRASCRDLAQARGEAVRAENLRVLGRMAGEVAHDFNNLLTAILGETQLLLQGSRAPGARQSLLVIEKAARDGAAAIRRIQHSTRVRAERELEVVDASKLLRDVLDLTRVRWASSGCGVSAIRVTCTIPPAIRVRGVAGELREVFTNIVTNAVDAMPDGGGLTVAVERRDSEVRVAISDTGCGMAAGVVDRIFDPFFTTKGERGNGLGLSIAHGIVQRHGGDIHVRSQLGAGTTMTVVLPVARGDVLDSPWDDAERDALGIPAAAGSSRALVVDDEPAVARVLGEMLRQHGFEVEVASDGRSANERLRATLDRFDVVVTDLYMPEVNGLDVAAVARATQPRARVILMTGCSNEISTASTQGSVDAVLAKPFSLEEVWALVGSSN